MKNFLLSFLLLSVFLAGCPLTDDSVNVQILTVDESENFLDAVTVYVYDSYSNLVNQVRSNNGVASVSLKKGTYEFKAYQEGYDSSSVVQTISQENPIVKIVLQKKEQSSNFVASVKVVSIDGVPVQKAMIELSNDNYNVVRYSNTDDYGVAVLSVPKEGTYKVIAKFNDNVVSSEKYLSPDSAKVELTMRLKECEGPYVYSCIQFLSIKGPNSALAEIVSPKGPETISLPSDSFDVIGVDKYNDKKLKLAFSEVVKVVGTDDLSLLAFTTLDSSSSDNYEVAVATLKYEYGMKPLLLGPELKNLLYQKFDKASGKYSSIWLYSENDPVKRIVGAGQYANKELAINVTRKEENLNFTLFDPATGKNISSIVVKPDSSTNLKYLFLDNNKRPLISSDVKVGSLVVSINNTNRWAVVVGVESNFAPNTTPSPSPTPSLTIRTK
ncbi:MAG: hypothetical protein QXX06_03280 [Candidatus Diapherotrites archaeon]